MSRALEAVSASLRGKLPNGWVLAGRGGVIDALLETFARPIADIEREAEELMEETDPRQAVRLLGDFERVLGADPCGRDQADLTLEQRQLLAHQRWTARGGQSIA